MDIFNQIAMKVIKEQELVIGPLAWIEAKKIDGLQITTKNDVLSVEITTPEDKKKDVIDSLITGYSRLFGQVSNEVCRHAVLSLIPQLPPTQIPTSLK